jgi:hypothetical protein
MVAMANVMKIGSATPARIGIHTFQNTRTIDMVIENGGGVAGGGSCSARARLPCAVESPDGEEVGRDDVEYDSRFDTRFLPIPDRDTRE